MELTELQKIVAWYGGRCAMQNGNGSTTPGVDFNEAVKMIEEIILKPRNEENFLIEITPDVYDEVKKYLSDEEMNDIELHYSPYWKRFKENNNE